MCKAISYCAYANVHFNTSPTTLLKLALNATLASYDRSEVASRMQIFSAIAPNTAKVRWNAALPDAGLHLPAPSAAQAFFLSLSPSTGASAVLGLRILLHGAVGGDPPRELALGHEGHERHQREHHRHEEHHQQHDVPLAVAGVGAAFVFDCRIDRERLERVEVDCFACGGVGRG